MTHTTNKETAMTLDLNDLGMVNGGVIERFDVSNKSYWIGIVSMAILGGMTVEDLAKELGFTEDDDRYPILYYYWVLVLSKANA